MAGAGECTESSLSARDQMETRSKKLGLNYRRGLEGTLETGRPCQPATQVKRLFTSLHTCSLHEERKYGARDPL